MRYRFGDRTHRDGDRAVEIFCGLQDALGEDVPVCVGFNARKNHQIARAFGKASDNYVVFGPTYFAFIVFVEIDLGSLMGEIKKWVRVDAGDDCDGAIVEAPLERGGCGTRRVEPSTKRDYEDGVAQIGHGIPVGFEHIFNIHREF